jgi:eukaryotic-like serine/threonine-protein kinase
VSSDNRIDPHLVAQLDLLASDATLTFGAMAAELGQYQLLGRLGSGGMGTVFRARHRRLKKIVALKVLRLDAQDDDGLSARFAREVEAIGQLQHPNIVQAYDAGEAGGVSYLAMELVEGRDVESLCRATGALPWRSACEIVRQAALGLQHAHERGFLHRDVKPSNLLISTSGVVKIADLGLARLVHSEAASLTDAGSVVGTANYVSPEQVRGDEIDARSDLYSLGCALYRMLAGNVPFPAPQFKTRDSKLHGHSELIPEPLGKVRPELPPELPAIVNRLMAKSPEDRFATAADLAQALESLTSNEELGELTKQFVLPLASDDPAGSAPLGSRGSTTSPNAGSTALIELPQRRPRAWNRIGMVAGCCLAGAISLAVGVSLYHRSAPLPFDDSQAQAHMPLNAWQPVLGTHDPVALVWPKDDANSIFKPTEDRFFLTCTGSGMASLGRMERPSYQLQMELHQHDWPGSCGFFWGGRQIRKPEGEVWRCQALQLTHVRGGRNADKYYLTRVQLEVPVDPNRGAHFSGDVARQEIPRPVAGAKSLEIKFLASKLVEVKWNGQILPELVKEELAPRISFEEHAGHFGIYLDSASCVVSDVRIKRLQ